MAVTRPPRPRPARPHGQRGRGTPLAGPAGERDRLARQPKMAVARYRERHSVARRKSDHVNAMALANILHTVPRSLPPPPPRPPQERPVPRRQHRCQDGQRFQGALNTWARGADAHAPGLCARDQ
ncbi:hypothetical protein D0T12_34205 [Actinomadura spongiicola]|uniref:Transposase n=1 Tax=Actinomadura spongiicola TaxID=2303421 RepID=A0A372G763_9ACTN|nr:hypothetical protein D0T12_34205 [Actinomadura spongiicola]